MCIKNWKWTTENTVIQKLATAMHSWYMQTKVNVSETLYYCHIFCIDTEILPDQISTCPCHTHIDPFYFRVCGLWDFMLHSTVIPVALHRLYCMIKKDYNRKQMWNQKYFSLRWHNFIGKINSFLFSIPATSSGFY